MRALVESIVHIYLLLLALFAEAVLDGRERQQQFESTNSHAGKMRRQHVPAILVHDLLLLGRTREQPRVRSQASASQHTASFSFVFVERGIRTRKPKTEEVR
jgi:hypothetical protein